MDWFERLTGFAEADPASTRARLAVDGEYLVSKVNGARHRIGRLECPTLASVRERAAALPRLSGTRPRVRLLRGDARALHQEPGLAGALFQVASQFNLLEMVDPDVTPEEGVSGYAFDFTQGPACAMAAGAATIYRNHLVPVDGQPGQTATRQLDMLADLGEALSAAVGLPLSQLWTMRNGYAMCSRAGLHAIDDHLAALDEAGRDALRQRLRIGLHWSVEVTDAPSLPGPIVSQAFCSALPVAYHRMHDAPWARFATLVLEAAYEATLLAAALHPTAVPGIGTPTVLLTQLGGGAFGNDEAWIDTAMRRALARLEGHGLDVAVVSFRAPSAYLLDLASG